MNYVVVTAYREATLKIDITATSACNISLWVQDADQENTFLTKRNRQFFAGEQNTLYVQMPLTGKRLLVCVFDTDQGIDITPDSFTVGRVQKLPMVRTLNLLNYFNADVRNFLPLCKRFSYNAGVLPLSTQINQFYTSRSTWKKVVPLANEFLIDYVDVIVQDGQESVTPASIGEQDHVIDVAQRYFVDLSVPVRVCILCHEFAHVYKNKDMYDEAEADINGLSMYFGMGFPVIEAEIAYTSMFKNCPTDQNAERYEKVRAFIDQVKQITAIYT